MVESSAVPQTTSWSMTRGIHHSPLPTGLNVDNLKRGSLIMTDSETQRVNEQLSDAYESGTVSCKYLFVKVSKQVADTVRYTTSNDQSIEKEDANSARFPRLVSALRSLIHDILQWRSPEEEKQQKLLQANLTIDKNNIIYGLNNWPPGETHPEYQAYKAVCNRISSGVPKSLNDIAKELHSTSIPVEVMSDLYVLINCDCAYFTCGSPTWMHRQEVASFIFEKVDSICTAFNVNLEGNRAASSRRMKRAIQQQCRPRSDSPSDDNVKQQKKPVVSKKDKSVTKPALLATMSDLLVRMSQEDHSVFYQEFKDQASWDQPEGDCFELDAKATSVKVFQNMIEWLQERLGS